jgi:hypothetical protein
MKRLVALVAAVAIAAGLWLLSGLASATPAAVAPTASARPLTATAVAAVVPTVVKSGVALHSGARLTSANGQYVLTVVASGQLAVTGHGKTLWHTSTKGSAPMLENRADGNLVLASHGHTLWQTNTRSSGRASLTLSNGGTLTLSVPSGTVWSSTLGNGCTTSHGKHWVVVDISQQRARLCSYHQQVLVTSVTTGASSLGDGTPTGTWRVYAKVRNTVLYPAAGGAYPVHYWMPYHGAYGMHDSPWQKFAYGSALYRTRGSHGCVHFPGKAMTRLYAWAPVGTVVTIHR